MTVILGVGCGNAKSRSKLETKVTKEDRMTMKDRGNMCLEYMHFTLLVIIDKWEW